MFYFIVFLILCVLSFFEYKGKHFKYLSYKVITLILTILACIRFGQGTDYFNYWYMYVRIPVVSKFAEAATLEYRTEPAYLFLCAIFRTLNIRYEVFIAIVAIVSMLLFYKFIKQYSKMPITSLAIFFGLYYVVYIFSAIRQGLVMAIFLALGIPLLKKRKYILYTLVVILAATLHTSLLITLILIPLIELKVPKKIYAILIGIVLLLMITNVDMKIIALLPQFLSEKILVYWGRMNIPLLAFGNRFITLLLILFFSSKIELDENTKLLKQVYIWSFILYVLTIKSSIISSRISVYLKVVEIIVIPNIIFILKNKEYYRKALALWAITLVLVFGLLVKNIMAFVGEGSYFKTLKLYEYPYITIYNKKELWEYRLKPENYYFLKEYLPFERYFEF